MTHLLDTNACIHLLRTKGNPHVRARLAATRRSDVVLCSVSVGELYYGAERSADPPRERAKVGAFVAGFVRLPFDDPAAHRFASVRADLDARGLPIGPLDIMIAATALIHGLKLVTHNTRDFGRIPGLPLEDWEVP